MFSQFYLDRKNAAVSETAKNEGSEMIQGSLAVYADNRQGHTIPVSRSNSRTWWEKGWQLRK
jgi:hypothetical protein